MHNLEAAYTIHNDSSLKIRFIMFISFKTIKRKSTNNSYYMGSTDKNSNRCDRIMYSLKNDVCILSGVFETELVSFYQRFFLNSKFLNFHNYSGTSES